MKLVLKLTLAACLPMFAADQVVLTNGDTITGAIVKKDGDKLTIKSEFLGEVTMPWTAVKSLRSDSEVFVQLSSGDVVKGKVTTSGNQLEVVGAQTRAAPLAQVTAVRHAAAQRAYERLLHPRVWDLWAGSFDFGLALARGNARTDTLTTQFSALRETRNDSVAVRFLQIYGTARANNVNSTIANALRGGWKYDRNLTPRVFLSVINNYEHDTFQNLDLRFVMGGGAGYKVVKREGLTLSIDGGADYDRENFMNGQYRNFAELNWGNDLAYSVSKATSITQAFHMFNNLTTTGEYRVAFDLSAVTAVRKWLGFHVTTSDRYVSNPVQGRQRNDILLSTGLRLSFAR